MNYELDGKIAWITGAAGALGSAIASTLALEGCRIVLSGRNADSLERTRAISKSGQVMVADLSQRGQVDKVATDILNQYGRIDILVNSVALSTFGDVLELRDEDWEGVLQAKFMGYLRTQRAVLPMMVKQKFGRIVNISGRGGRQPTPAHLPGCSANAAVHVLTKGLADIYARHNIRINAVAPGPIESARLNKIIDSNQSVAEQSGGGARSATAYATPMVRLGTPQEIADAVAFLVSERSSYITGTIQAVDGGGTVSI